MSTINEKSVANMITNKKVYGPIYVDEALTWREIIRTQREKVEVLREWFNEIGSWPRSNSTPVFDITEQKVYPSYSLTQTYTSPITGESRMVASGPSTYFHIKEAIQQKKAVDWNPYRANAYAKVAEEINGHVFIAVSDVSEVILNAALEKYREDKETEKMHKLFVDLKAKEETEKEEKIDSLLTAIDNLKAEVEALKK